MLTSIPHRVSFLMGLGVAVVLLCEGCGGEKYRTVVDAAETGLSSLTLADDYRHQRRLQEALLAEPAFAGLVLTSYVIMDHGYVIGHVQSPEQAEAVYQAASKVEGLRSLNAFLPVKRPSTVDSVGKGSSDAELKAQVEAALARTPGVVDTRVHVEILDDRAVLLGVVSGSEEKTRAEHAVASTLGVKRIINWLLLPDTDYLAIRSQVF
jgi:osmotically-inducible protein OsmY